MQHTKVPEFLDLARPVTRSRSTSMSGSDTQFTRPHLLTPPTVTPPPSFIASNSASQIITADQEFNAADFVGEDEEEGSSASALVTPDALSALNAFLDHLLFNMLGGAKSTNLAAIRPAVAEVLKPRLAREVVAAADDELCEYLGGPEEDVVEYGGEQSAANEFDLIPMWKRARLRCMVYSRLGDMEEDEEEEYIQQEGLGENDGMPGGFPGSGGGSGYITPGTAIFLTSIIEYLGEKALVIAGETARSRLSRKTVAEHDDASSEVGAGRGSMDRLVVEDHDMEKLALNPTLGRLWRTWRKRIRTPSTLSRAVSREQLRRRTMTNPSRKSTSFITSDDIPPRPRSTPVPEKPQPQQEVDPASIALPMSEHDVQEIEIPGFNAETEKSEVSQAVVAHKVRPRSLMVLTLPSPRSPTSMMGSPTTPMSQGGKPNRHIRSLSLPSDGSESEHSVERTPTNSSEEQKRLATMYEHEEDDETHGERLIAVAPTVKKPISQQKRPLSKISVSQSAPERSTEDIVAQENVDTPTVPDASVEAVPSRSSSTDVSATSISESAQPESESEIIEGQGMREKPSLSAMQRPKRQSPKKDERSPSSGDRVVQTVVEVSPRTQGAGDSTASQAAVNQGGTPKNFESDLSTADSSTPLTQSSGEEVNLDKFPRPMSSGSEAPRPRHKPSPLSLNNNQRPDRSSAAVSVASSGTERAAVQRLSGRPTTSGGSSTHSKPRRSESLNSSNDKRPVTSGSSTSQKSNKLKGLIKGEGSPRLRTSSDTSRASVNTNELLPDDRSGLDELIRSDETIHYTLTPRSMREMNIPNPPKVPAGGGSPMSPQRSSTVDLADFFMNTPPPSEAVPRPTTSNTSSRDPAENTVPAPKASESPKQKPSEAPRVVPKRPVVPQRPAGQSQARDAKPAGGSTRDFADFLKNTGPPDVPPSQASSKPAGGFVKSQRRLSSATDLSKKLSRPTSNSSSRTSGTKLQARSAVAPKGDHTSDLIDFIREGPPPTPGAHRIPRTVAPFRNTMDSDELQTLEPGPTDKVGSSTASTQNGSGSMATKSMTSLGSRTGLLDSSKRAPPHTSTPSETITALPAADVSEDPFPARKQRRVRDPYAIDSDDDEDLEELLEAEEKKKPAREEESLADFLKNAPPPPTDNAPQLLTVNMPPPKSSSSASSMKNRLLRTGPSSKSSKTSLRQQAEAPAPASGSSNYALKVGGGGGPDRNVSSHGLPSVSERQTETSALADFLRSTGPPEPPPQARKESKTNGISQFFARRKKVEV